MHEATKLDTQPRHGQRHTGPNTAVWRLACRSCAMLRGAATAQTAKVCRLPGLTLGSSLSPDQIHGQ